MVDALTISPIADVWRCSVCYHQHHIHSAKCQFCGYSIAATVNNTTEKLALYRQIWHIHDACEDEQFAMKLKEQEDQKQIMLENEEQKDEDHAHQNDDLSTKRGVRQGPG